MTTYHYDETARCWRITVTRPDGTTVSGVNCAPASARAYIERLVTDVQRPPAARREVCHGSR